LLDEDWGNIKVDLELAYYSIYIYYKSHNNMESDVLNTLQCIGRNAHISKTNEIVIRMHVFTYMFCVRERQPDRQRQRAKREYETFMISF
jgi:hypothetical protein